MPPSPSCAPVRCMVAAALLLGSFTVVASAGAARSAHPNGYQYVSPVPGSWGVSTKNNIIIRNGLELDPATVSQTSLTVTGVTSGVHSGRLTLADDGRTLVFKPARPFAAGERVTVTMLRTPRAMGGAALPPLAFGFTAAKALPAAYRGAVLENEDEFGDVPEASHPAVVKTPAPSPEALNDLDLPASYPPVTLLVSDHPDPGMVFCTPAKRPSDMNNMMILDNNAMPIFYRNAPSRPVDFKMLPDGRLAYFESAVRTVYVLDSNYAPVDSFKAGNGYDADSHDFEVLPNNHALILINDPQPFDMSTIVTGGDPNAIVVGAIVQEVDDQNNVLWQWRSWDHFQITDMNTGCASLTDSRIDYVHPNAVLMDTDGNVLLSGRYLNEITKIDRQTGDVIWRFGLNSKNNQFTIYNDPYGFSDQHNVMRSPEGLLTLFDNHQCIDPKVTRVLEYSLDEQHLIATLVREYHHTPEQYAASGGGYQPRAGGSGMVAWGNSSTPPGVTDIHPDNSTGWEIEFWPAPARTISYRAYRFPWHPSIFTTDVDSLDFGTVSVGDSAMHALVVTNHAPWPMTFTSFVSLDDAFSVEDAPPITVPSGGNVTVQAKFRPGHGGDFKSTLYVRSTDSTEVFAYPVIVTGQGDTQTPVLFQLFEADWTDAGVEVRWQLGEPASFASTRIERRVGTNGAWLAIDGDVHQDAGTMVLLDRGAVAGREYWYRVVATTLDGQMVTSEPVRLAGVDARFALTKVGPNPGPGPVRIAFSLARQAHVRISIVDVQGRRVATLADGVYTAGAHEAQWMGGRAGLYFVRYEWPGGNQVKRLAITR